MVRLLSRFWHDRRAVSLTEGLIAFPVVFLTITTFIEGGLAVYQYNQVVKAVAVGARLAAVSDPVVDATATLKVTDPDFLDSKGNLTDGAGNTLQPGAPLPLGIDPIICGRDAQACNSTKLNRLVSGTTASCDAARETGVMGMCDVAPRIQPENVRVTYMFTGLGYAGRPYNPVVTVKVEVRDVRFEFFLLGAVIGAVTGAFGPSALKIPPQSVTITSEDLSTTPLGASGSGT